MIHYLKTWPKYFEKVVSGDKTFEIRKNDRNFEEGDIVVLREWNPETNEYTGEECAKDIGYILNGGQFGLEEGYVCFSFM